MEENTKLNGTDEKEERRHYTKQQNVLYTIISIGLFCLLYFGGKGIWQLANRPYYCFQNPANVNEEKLDLFYGISGISDNFGLTFENARLYKDKSSYSMEILFSGIKDTDDFAENGIMFQHGDIKEDIRINFYPYFDNPAFEEYAFASEYLNIEETAHPNSSIYVFEYEDEIFVKYQEYGYQMPSETKALFSDCEKVY